MPSLGTLLDLDLPSLLSLLPHLYSKLALPNLILLWVFQNLELSVISPSCFYFTFFPYSLSLPISPYIFAVFPILVNSVLAKLQALVLTFAFTLATLFHVDHCGWCLAPLTLSEPFLRDLCPHPSTWVTPGSAADNSSPDRIAQFLPLSLLTFLQQHRKPRRLLRILSSFAFWDIHFSFFSHSF